MAKGGTSWAMLSPIAQELVKLGLVQPAVFARQMKDRLRHDGQTEKTDNTIYRWLVKGNEPRPDKQTGYNILAAFEEELIAAVRLGDVANSTEYTAIVEQAIKEGSVLHLNKVAGSGLPLPPPFLDVPDRLEDFIGQYGLFRLVQGEQAGTTFLQQVPCRLFRDGTGVVFEAALEEDSQESSERSGFGYLVGETLCFLKVQQHRIGRTTIPGVFFSCFNLDVPRRTNDLGWRGICVAGDTFLAYPSCQKAILVGTNDVSWLTHGKEWRDFADNEASTYEVAFQGGSTELADQSLKDDHKRDLKQIIQDLLFGEWEVGVAQLSTTYTEQMAQMKAG